MAATSTAALSAGTIDETVERAVVAALHTRLDAATAKGRASIAEWDDLPGEILDRLLRDRSLAVARTLAVRHRHRPEIRAALACHRDQHVRWSANRVPWDGRLGPDEALARLHHLLDDDVCRDCSIHAPGRPGAHAELIELARRLETVELDADKRARADATLAAAAATPPGVIRAIAGRIEPGGHGADRVAEALVTHPALPAALLEALVTRDPVNRAAGLANPACRAGFATATVRADPRIPLRHVIANPNVGPDDLTELWELAATAHGSSQTATAMVDLLGRDDCPTATITAICAYALPSALGNWNPGNDLHARAVRLAAHHPNLDPGVFEDENVLLWHHSSTNTHVTFVHMAGAVASSVEHHALIVSLAPEWTGTLRDLADVAARLCTTSAPR